MKGQIMKINKKIRKEFIISSKDFFIFKEKINYSKLLTWKMKKLPIFLELKER